jgi:ferredoxin
MITEECINCGACVPECPNQAIARHGPTFVIDPDRCTEYVGFHDYEARQAICPVERCVADPARVEAERTLYERAKRLHPEIAWPPLEQLPASRSRRGYIVQRQ